LTDENHMGVSQGTHWTATPWYHPLVNLFFPNKKCHNFDVFSQYNMCEQNDPCSGCYPKSFQEHLAFVFSSVSMAATEERLVFLEVGT
jgi:hypothetical protein